MGGWSGAAEYMEGVDAVSLVDFLEIQRWNRRTLHARAVYFHEQDNPCARRDCPRSREEGDTVCVEHRIANDESASRMRAWRARQA